MFHNRLVFSSEELQLGSREKSKLFKAGFYCLKVEPDFLVFLNVSSRYFDMLYFLCGFFGDGVRRRVFGNSGWRHAGGIKGLLSGALG